MPRAFWKVGYLVVLVALLASTALSADLQISSTQHSYLNCYDTQDSVSISVTNLSAPISGFRFALGIDEVNVSLLEVKPGAFMNDCQWEYLNWKITRPASINQLPFDASHITAVLQIDGFAAASAGHVATCFNSSGQLELVKLSFLLATSDPLNQCAFLPLRFYWRDCRDNVLYSMTGDTAYVASQVAEGTPIPQPLAASFPGFGSPASLCDTTSTKHAIPLLSAINGGFDLLCVSSGPFCTGDLNLNGHAFEVADLVMYANYFINGLNAFNGHVQGSIAQSDIDLDGNTLTIPDFVAMVHIVLDGAPALTSQH